MAGTAASPRHMPPHRPLPCPVGACPMPLPPASLVLSVHNNWTTIWLILVHQLAPFDPETDAFTHSASGFPGVMGTSSARLDLYIGLPGPWEHHALLVRELISLDNRLPVSVVVPGDDDMWSFTSDSLDTLYSKRKLWEVYVVQSGGVEGRVTVPMPWDVKRREMVCNESIKIAKFFSGLVEDSAGLDC